MTSMQEYTCWCFDYENIFFLRPSSAEIQWLELYLHPPPRLHCIHSENSMFLHNRTTSLKSPLHQFLTLSWRLPSLQGNLAGGWGGVCMGSFSGLNRRLSETKFSFYSHFLRPISWWCLREWTISTLPLYLVGTENANRTLFVMHVTFQNTLYLLHMDSLRVVILCGNTSLYCTVIAWEVGGPQLILNTTSTRLRPPRSLCSLPALKNEE